MPWRARPLAIASVVCSVFVTSFVLTPWASAGEHSPAVGVTAHPPRATVAAALAAAAAPGPQHAPGDRAGRRERARAPSLSDETGLTAAITGLSPSVLEPGDPVQLSGTVTNGADYVWHDLQVYLEVSTTPATSNDALAAAAELGDAKFGEIVTDLGYFAEIGGLKPGETTAFSLDVPYGRLPGAASSGEPGVYQVGVSVLGTPRREIRDLDADARTHTQLPLVDPDAPAGKPTATATLLPLTAPVARQPDGPFLDDRLALEVAPGGRLDNVLAFAANAPLGSLDIVVDPALLTAVESMRDGYEVQSLTEEKDGVEPQPGSGSADAEAWLGELETVAARQRVSVLPWANPDSSGLASAGMPGVVDATVQSSRRFAFLDSVPNKRKVVDWQPDGASTRRGLSVAARAGATTHVVSEASLVKLVPDEDGYPPEAVTINTERGPLSAAVTRTELAAVPLDATMTAVAFRQALLADAAIRSAAGGGATTVAGLPFRWDPGPPPADLDLLGAFASPVIRPVSLGSVLAGYPPFYVGPVEVTTDAPGYTTGQLDAIAKLRNSGRVYSDLLADGRQTQARFDRVLASSASSTWQYQPKRGEALTRQTARAIEQQVRSVTVTGPEFVAMSSGSGRFPLTVDNGLDVPVTVTLRITSANSAVRFDPLDPIVLDAGERRDVEVQSRAAGSGVTVVRARLATESDRVFGKPWVFDVRATRIGLAIWVFMGVLGAAVFSGAAIRIVQRFRGGGFTPRGDVP